MSFLGSPPNQARKPFAEVLPDGRKRLTRYFKVATTGQIPPELNYAPGTADFWSGTSDGAPAGWTGLLLTYKQFKDSERGFPQEGEDDKPIVQLIYEQISATGETETGGEDPTQLPDGRKEVVFTYVMFTTSTYTPQTVGSSTAPSPYTSYYLVDEKADNDGTLRNITRRYQTAGQVGQEDESLQGGNLLIRTIKSAFTVPATPSGYTLVDSQVDQNLGYPIYAYRFAKGTGEVGRTIDYNQSADQGTTGATVTTIKYLVVPGASVQPTSLAGSVLIGQSSQDTDGYRIWTTVWAKGTGLVAQNILTRNDGLREVTNIALGSKSTPAGTVIRDDYRNVDGYTVYTVTALQPASGSGSITTVSFSFERYVPFTYPGRAKPYTETLGAVTAANVFYAPPVETLVKGTVTVSYGTTTTLGTISDFWNPTDWATMRASWVGNYGYAGSIVKSLKGYRATTTTAVTLTGSGFNATIFGNNIYAGTTATLYVTGGPADPGGTTKTLSAEIEPAFTDTSGTQYFRTTKVSAAIPSQPALPV